MVMVMQQLIRRVKADKGLMRVFVTCGAGFVLRHSLPYILDSYPDARLTLLLLAKTQAEADKYLQNLLDILGLNAVDRMRIRAVPGDLRLPNLGLSEISKIDSNYWLNGTLPFRFGAVRPQSLHQADLITRNFLNTLDKYSATVENVDHYIQISSLRVGGRSGVPLPESLNYPHVTFGNFDRCKYRVEELLGNWLTTRTNQIKMSVVRIPSLVSPDVSRIGGAILLLTKELLGFGRYIGWPQYFPADDDAILRFIPAASAGYVIGRLITIPPNEDLRVINVCDNSNKLSISEYKQLIMSMRHGLDPAKDVSLISLDEDRTTKLESTYYQWFYETFGWLTLRSCTAADPEIRALESFFSRPWRSPNDGAESKKLLSAVLATATSARFVSVPVNLGEFLIY
jgi:nucleoside-diphosphate-sugar epimerase